MEIDRAILERVFDTAVGSMDFGSGFLDDEEVSALRACAVLLGRNPMVGTPDKFKCKYGVPHEWIRTSGGQYCGNCHAREIAK